MIFPFLILQNNQYNINDDWKPERYEYEPYGSEWLRALGIKQCYYGEMNVLEERICLELDHFGYKFVTACEHEFCTSRYLDNQWVYEFEDGDDVINKLIEFTLENFDKYMYPLDKEICDEIFPKVKRELFKIGREYFTVQFDNQIMFNFKCGIGRKSEQSNKVLRWQILYDR